MPSLTDIFARACGARGQVAHLAIDVQNAYIMDGSDVGIAKKIGHEIAPEFSKLNIPTYWVHYTPQHQSRTPWSRKSIFPQPSPVDFSKYVSPKCGDRVVEKTDISAFGGGALPDLLRADKKRILLVSGFTYAVCVHDTVRDARRSGYDVVLMTDATDYNADYDFIETSLNRNGIVMAPSQGVMQCAASLSR